MIAAVVEFAPSPRPTSSPWEAVQDAKEKAPGIWWVSTASHGGYIISQQRRDAMPGPLKNFDTFAGGNNYEEDCDWAIVALAFPDLFSDYELDAAVRTIETSIGWAKYPSVHRAQLEAVLDCALNQVLA